MIEIKGIKISELKAADYNPREKSEHVLASVRQSIKEYGFLQPVVVNTHECEKCGNRKNIIVGGHRRIEAAKAEGLEIIFFKGDPETIKTEFKNPPPIQRDILSISDQEKN